jgi:hypothetical protein
VLSKCGKPLAFAIGNINFIILARKIMALTGYFIEKCSEVIYYLLIGEGTSKERLLKNEIKIQLCLSINLPKEFDQRLEKLESVLYSVPEVRRPDNDQTIYTSFNNSVCKMRKAKASKVIDELYGLYLAVKDYEEDMQRNKA